MKFHATRLKYGDDLRETIIQFVIDHGIKSGVVGSAVGSLYECNIRLAGATPEEQQFISKIEDLEIVSLIGTVGNGKMHLHMSVSDSKGTVFGGHLKEGCFAKTTIELVIIEDEKFDFDRKLDKSTGFDELKITELP